MEIHNTTVMMTLMHVCSVLFNRCLKDEAGEVAFVKHLTVPGQFDTIIYPNMSWIIELYEFRIVKCLFAEILLNILF